MPGNGMTSRGEYITDLDMPAYLNYVVSTQPLKGVPAFDSKDIAGSRASGDYALDELFGWIREITQ